MKIDLEQQEWVAVYSVIAEIPKSEIVAAVRRICDRTGLTMEQFGAAFIEAFINGGDKMNAAIFGVEKRKQN